MQLPMRERLVLLLLASAAFVLTIVIAARHQSPWSAPTLPRAEVPTSGQSHPDASLLIARSDPPPPARPSTPRARSEAPPASPAGSEGITDSAEADPPKTLQVRLRVMSSADTGVTLNLMNLGPDALDLKVTAADISGGSQSTVAVNIPALTTADLTRAGLVAEHGSELTLESPGYVTRQMMVR
jgi:hypothetical protein